MPCSRRRRREALQPIPPLSHAQEQKGGQGFTSLSLLTHFRSLCFSQAGSRQQEGLTRSLAKGLPPRVASLSRCKIDGESLPSPSLAEVFESQALSFHQSLSASLSDSPLSLCRPLRRRPPAAVGVPDGNDNSSRRRRRVRVAFSFVSPISTGGYVRWV